MPTIRVHIGPVKTASTAIQEMLRAGRSQIEAAGYLYPTPAQDINHLEAICDFLYISDLPPMPESPLDAEFISYRPIRRKGAWQKLLTGVASHDGPSVISHEILGFFDIAHARHFIRQLPSDDVEVILVRRRPSQLLASAYQEFLKHRLLPDFQGFIQVVFDDLISPTPGPYAFLDNRNLERTWSAAGARVIIIDAETGLNDDVITKTGEALTPGLTWQAPATALNVSMSNLGLHLWRRHIEYSKPARMAAAHSVRKRMLRTYPETAGTPKLTMPPDLASSLDAFCKGELTELPTVQELPAFEVPAGFDFPAALRQMHRWQQVENLRWGALSTASAAVGRGALMGWVN